MVLRSMLFVPGNSMRMITKAATLPSDAIILDLEDAVPLPDKGTARIMVRDSEKALNAGGSYVFTRVNALPTNLTEEDLSYVVTEGLDGIMLAKTETESDVETLEGMLNEAEKSSGLKTGSLAIIPLVESTKGILNAYEIASASERVVAVAFGAGDYYRDLGRDVAALSREEVELLYARSHLVNASRAAGIQTIDTPFFGLLTDREGFIDQATLALRLGFKGKLLVHPMHIELVNRIFSPSESEVEYAGRLVEAFEEAQERGLGAISFDGKMVDIMNYKQSKDLVNLVEIITQKEKRRKETPAISLSHFFTASSSISAP